MNYYLNKLKGTQHLMCILLCILALSFSSNIFGQSISTPVVTGTPVCGGSSIQVSFRVTNGNGSNERFRTTTTYELFDITGGQEFQTGSFTASNAPNNRNGASAQITLTVPIPNNAGLYPTSNDYQVRVRSTNPDANFSPYSSQFIVNNDPTPTPTASNSGPICIGGDVNLTASNISGATYSWTGPNGFTSNLQNPTLNNSSISMAGTYRVTATVNGCTSAEATTDVTGSASLDDQTTRGTNSWIGHVYDGVNFNTYAGNYTTPFFFNENFGGNANCYEITSNGSPIDIYTETFSVIYKANITVGGVYTVDIGADDGNRLKVDGNLVYDDWNDHGYRVNNNILLNLSGNTNLDLEYYENGGGNRISLANAQLIIENILSANTSQTVCQNENALTISGDTFATLPTGISLVGTGYQWYYNTTGDPTATIIIAGATDANFTPDLTSAPFNSPGIYSIYRKVLLNGSNNTAQIEHISNAATLEISSNPTLSLTGPTTACLGESVIIAATFQGQAPYTVTYEVNGSSTTTTESQDYIEYPFTITGDTTIEFTNITDANSCTSAINEIIAISIENNLWTGAVNTDWNNQGNWSCNTIPSLTSDVLIPSGLSNYPILNTGAVGTVKDLSIESGATLEILDNTLEIAGSINNSGVFDITNGEIAFRGSSSQNIPTNVFLNNTVENLTINNSSGVINSSNLMITGILKVTIGNFSTGGTLTLVSDATQTALIDGSGNGSIIGDITMQRYLDPALGYKYLSSPFQNTTTSDYSGVVDLSATATFPNFYRYNENRENSLAEDATGFEKHSGALNILEGYALNFGNASASKTVEISGTVNNGAQQMNLSHNNGTFSKGFNLVGNPYPSPIDWNATSGWTKDNIDDAVYFFTASDHYTGVYTSFVNGVQSGGGSLRILYPLCKVSLSM